MAIRKWMLGAAASAGLMYLLDPDHGRRRRALLRDQIDKFANRFGDRTEAMLEMTRDRAQGLTHEIGEHLSPGDVEPSVLAARIRSEMGHHVSHARMIEVEVDHNRSVKLSGMVLANEVQPLVAAVRNIPGVRHVDNQLHAVKDDVEMQIMSGNAGGS